MTLNPLASFFQVPAPHLYGRCGGSPWVGFAFHHSPGSLPSVLINCEMDRERKEGIAKHGKFSMWTPCLEAAA